MRDTLLRSCSTYHDSHNSRLALLFPLLLPFLLAAACQVAPPPEAVAPAAESAARIAPGARRYVVDPQASEVRLLVYRDGPLARFGHNHVIIGRLRGEIGAGDSAATSSFAIEIPVDSFAVDPVAVRAEEGADFAAEVSEPARQGTRDNMLGADVLDAARHPLIRIESAALSGPRWNPEVAARLTLRGRTAELRFPAAVFEQNGTLVVIARFSISQSELGMQPFSVLGGGLRVRDALDIRVRVVARRAPS